MSNPKKYQGGCHCGAVRYEVEADIETLFSCNCSICSKKAHLLHFVPATQFELLSGDDGLTDYQFNKKNVHHVFCKVCGVQSFAWGTAKDGTKTSAVNVRCLDDFDVTSVPMTMVDGKRL